LTGKRLCRMPDAKHDPVFTHLEDGDWASIHSIMQPKSGESWLTESELDVLRGLLRVEPDARMTMRQALSITSPWGVDISSTSRDTAVFNRTLPLTSTQSDTTEASTSEDDSLSLRVVPLSLAAMELEIESPVRQWKCESSQAIRTLKAALSLAVQAASGCCFIIAPPSEVIRLKKCVHHSDGGYMTQKLKDKHIGSSDFQRAFLEFATFTDSGRWPMSHPDVTARDQPKDGAIVLSSSGSVKKAAANLVGLPKAPYSWPQRGMRHTSALQAASVLDHCVVVVKSDGADLHVLLSRPGGVDAFLVEPKSLADHVARSLALSSLD